LIDGSETGFFVSPKCSTDSRSAYPNIDSSVLGSPSGASLAPIEFSVGGIFPTPMSIGLVGGLFLNLWSLQIYPCYLYIYA
jgi:hypothetical protein